VLLQALSAAVTQSNKETANNPLGRGNVMA
jgi:hypothetical protein